MPSVQQNTQATDQTAFHFMPAITVLTRSRRDVELAASSAKSHLAKLQHRKRALEVQVVVRSVDNSQRIVAAPAGADKDDKQSQASPSPFPKADSRQNRQKIKRTHKVRFPNSRSKSDDGTRCRRIQVQDSRPPLRNHKAMSDSALVPSLSVYRPFEWSTLSSRLTDTNTVRLLRYSVTTMWPRYEPRATSDHTPRFTLSWSDFENLGPVLFHSMMWHAAMHLSFRTRKTIQESGSLNHKQEVLSHVSKSLQRMSHQIDETTLFAIMGLTTQEAAIEDDWTNPLDGFTFPLQDLMWLSVYGRKPRVSSHMAALYYLIDLRGGPDGLVMPGFSGALQFTDVINSTYNLSRPRYPICRNLARNNTMCDRRTYFGHAAEFEDESILPLSRDVDQLVEHGLSSPVLEALQDLRAWTRLLQKYTDQAVAQPELALVAVMRFIIQHRLLSTLPDNKSTEPDLTAVQLDPSDDAAIIPLVQTGLLTFSIGVTFPMICRDLHKTLSERLQNLLNRSFALLIHWDLHNFVTWLCIVGALAAVQADERERRSWFIDILCQTEASELVQEDLNRHAGPDRDTAEGMMQHSPGARSWSVVRNTCLSPFLWHDSCDAGAEKIWTEVQWRSWCSMVPLQ